MKRRRMLAWVTVLLYIASTLGIAALAEEEEEWFEDPSPAAETVTAAPSEPEPQPEPEDQPPQKPADQGPADPPSFGGDEPQPEGQEPNAPPSGENESQSDQAPAAGSEPAPWQNPSDGPNPGGDESDPAENPLVFTVLFITPNGRILLAYEAAAGTAVADPRLSPTMKGYTFSHWYGVGSNPNVSFHFGSPLEGNLTLAAFFKQVTAAELETSDPDSAEQEPAGEEPEEAADPAEEDPTDEDLAEETPEDEALEDEGLEEEVPEDDEDLPPIQVSITSDAGDTVRLGDRVTMTAHVSEQAEGETLTLWRYNAGSGWVVAATNTLTHSLVVDENNHGWSWEFRITVIVGVAD